MDLAVRELQPEAVAGDDLGLDGGRRAGDRRAVVDRGGRPSEDVGDDRCQDGTAGHARILPAVKVLRAAAWLGGGALVVLAARAIVYALSPRRSRRPSRARPAGRRCRSWSSALPRSGSRIAAAVLWLAALGVRERRLLARRIRRRRSRLARIAVRAAVLVRHHRSPSRCWSRRCTGAPASAGTGSTA